MLIQMLLVVLIIGMLIAGPSVADIWTLAAVIGGLLLMLWYSRRFSEGIANLLLGGMGSTREEQTYSLGEKYEIEHDYDAAIEQYMLAARKDKKSPTPRLKLANLYYKLEDYDNCLKYLEEALRMSKGMPVDNRCTVVNRVADIYIQNKQDSSSAVRVLKRFAEQFPNTQYASYARDRISQIEGNG